MAERLSYRNFQRNVNNLNHFHHKIIMSDEAIIINEEALTEAFIPTRLLHREGQVRELERCLRPVLKNRSIENIFW